MNETSKTTEKHSEASPNNLTFTGGNSFHCQKLNDAAVISELVEMRLGNRRKLGQSTASCQLNSGHLG